MGPKLSSTWHIQVQSWPGKVIKGPRVNFDGSKKVQNYVSFDECMSNLDLHE